jgi:hypothetical protein
MKNSNEFIKFTANLATAIKHINQPSQLNTYAPLISQVIMDVLPSLSLLEEELRLIDKVKKAELIETLRAMKVTGTNPDVLVKLAFSIVNILIKNSTTPQQGALAADIQLAFYYILILIGDLTSSDVFFKSKCQYALNNPTEDFWLQRIFIAGSHEFNTDGIYLINSIPPATSEKNYN